MADLAVVDEGLFVVLAEEFHGQLAKPGVAVAAAVVVAAVAVIVLLPFALYARWFVVVFREPNWFESFAFHRWEPRNSKYVAVDLLAGRRHPSVHRLPAGSHSAFRAVVAAAGAVAVEIVGAEAVAE